MPYNIAVIGATGNVGRELLGMLAERDFPVSNIDALASSESIAQGGFFWRFFFASSCLKTLPIILTFRLVHIVVCLRWSGGFGSPFSVFIPLLSSCYRRDSSHFRMHKDVQR